MNKPQSHPGIAGRHPHGLPSYHLEGYYGIHPFNRRSPPSLGARCGRSSPQAVSTYHRRHLWRPSSHGTSTPNCAQANITRQERTYRWPAPWLDTSPGSPETSAGSVHDVKAIKESGLIITLDAQSHIGEKGYSGLGIITLDRKPAHGELVDTDKRNNTTINRVRTSLNASSQTSRLGASSAPITAASATLSKPQYKPSLESSSSTAHE